jgi:hypothetical protein
MRNPLGSETEAFWLTITTALIVAIAALAGWLASVLAGVCVFIVLALVALAVALRSSDATSTSLSEAARAPHPHAPPVGVRHVLVVAHAPLGGKRLLRNIEDAGDATVELDVLAPVRTSRTHLAYTDIDRETELARRRLAHSMDWARRHGLRAHGEIGEAGATTAIEDRLRDSGADEVIIVTASADPAHWQERLQLERLREELEIPVAHVASGVDP